MFCVIVKVNGYAGDDTMVLGPYEKKLEARKAQRNAKSELMTMAGFKSENISSEIKEMVKF